jgi:SAM-dependent methyltransferase
MVETNGQLDNVRVDGGELTLEGWAATVAAGSIENFRVTCAGRVLENLEVRTGLPSPDVQAVHPSLDGAGECRFQLRAALNGVKPEQARSAVIALTPLTRREEGCILIHLIEPVLPAPKEEYAHAVGGGDVFTLSNSFLGYFIQLASLQPDAHVLDIGCGFGRMAYALAHYLSPSARYEGLDVIGNLIEWAQQSISPRFPNFAFRKVDIFNKLYNPRGALKAVDYRFPYEHDSFDLIFLTSVFTHLQGVEVRHYLDEIRRVLRPGGSCLTTCFLLDHESERLIREGKSTQNLAHPSDDCFIANPDIPEAAVGFKEELLLGWIAKRGLMVTHKLHGTWCGRASLRDYQDVLVYKKPESLEATQRAIPSTETAFGQPAPGIVQASMGAEGAAQSIDALPKPARRRTILSRLLGGRK